MSDTPKTDAVCGWPVGHHGRIESSDLVMDIAGPFVHSSVARELERENKQLRQTVLETLNQRGQRELIVAWDRAKELERENAALRDAIEESEEFARKNGEACGSKIRELLAENAALRETLINADELERYTGSDGHRQWGKCSAWLHPDDAVIIVSAKALDAARKEAQP